MDAHRLFVSSFYNGSMMLKLDSTKPAATLLWKGKAQSEMARLTDGLHSIMSTPYFKGNYIYGVCSYGGTPGVQGKKAEPPGATVHTAPPPPQGTPSHT